jgi:hypothetical protein
MLLNSKSQVNIQNISFLCFFLFFTNFLAFSQSKFSNKEDLLSTPRQYTVVFNPIAPVVDGKLNDAVWQNVPWTEYFKDIEGDKRQAPTWNTRAKMTWDDQGLYIAAELLDPHVWAYLKNYDDIVFYDNDFEIFIDPDNDTHRYYEFEVNALNTMFDLFMPKPYRNGSGAMIVYNTPGMKWAVDVQGTLNDPSDTDKGWTTEIFIPFSALTIGNSPKIPIDGDFWRINFSRVEWDTEVKDGQYVKKKDTNGKNLPEHNWVWSPQGVVNMHFPERWAYLFFSKKDAGLPETTFSIPYSEEQKKHLWHAYYLQKDYFQKNNAYASSLSKLGIDNLTFTIDGKENKLWMEATSRQFMVYISAGADVYTLNDEGLVHLLEKKITR